MLPFIWSFNLGTGNAIWGKILSGSCDLNKFWTGKWDGNSLQEPLLSVLHTSNISQRMLCHIFFPSVGELNFRIEISMRNFCPAFGTVPFLLFYCYHFGSQSIIGTVKSTKM